MTYAKHIARPTKDLDAVAIHDGRGLVSSDPLTEYLREAIEDVARILDLDPRWFNGGPMNLLEFGLPTGFLERAQVEQFGTLTLRVADRPERTVTFRADRHPYLVVVAGLLIGRATSTQIALGDRGSVVKRRPATDEAFSSAVRTTFVGSMTPEFTRSSYCSVGSPESRDGTAGLLGRLSSALPKPEDDSCFEHDSMGAMLVLSGRLGVLAACVLFSACEASTIGLEGWAWSLDASAGGPDGDAAARNSDGSTDALPSADGSDTDRDADSQLDLGADAGIRFTTTGGPPGPVAALAQSASHPDNLYVAGPRGVFESENGGATWDGPRTLGVREALALKVSPVDPYKLFAHAQLAGGESALLHSSDAGRSWSVISEDSSEWLAVGPSVVVTKGANGLMKSRNEGATWRSILSIDSNLQFNALAIDRHAGHRLIASAGTALRWSDDAGETWNSSALDVPALNFVMFDPADDSIAYAGVPYFDSRGSLFESGDGGATWRSLHPTEVPFLPFGSPHSMALSTSGPRTFYLGTHDGEVWKSTNHGGEWQSASNGLPRFRRAPPVTSLLVNHPNPERLFAGTRGPGLYRSLDGGATWVASSRGLATASVTVLKVDPAIPGRLYAGTRHGGVFVRPDRGAEWILSSDEALDTEIRDLLIEPASSEVLYAATGASGRSSFCRSRNSGASWTDLGPVAASAGNVVASIPTRAGLVYAATYGAGVVVSADHGTTWELTGGAVASPEMDIDALVAIPTEPPTLHAVSSLGRIYKSGDGGATWFPTETGVPEPFVHQSSVLVIAPSDPRTLYYGAKEWGGARRGRLLKSADGGMSWVDAGAGLPLADHGVGSLLVDAADPEKVYAGVDERLFRTIDGGLAWTEIGNGLHGVGLVQSLALEAGEPSILYVGTSLGGVFAGEVSSARSP